MLKISYHESHMLALAWLPRRGRFDFIVVTLSLAALGPLNVPVVVIRSMRAFRVARLFRRVLPPLPCPRSLLHSEFLDLIPLLHSEFLDLISLRFDAHFP